MRKDIAEIEAHLDGLEDHRRIEMAAWRKKLEVHEAFFPPVDQKPFQDVQQSAWDRWHTSFRGPREFNWNPPELKPRQ